MQFGCHKRIEPRGAGIGIAWSNGKLIMVCSEGGFIFRVGSFYVNLVLSSGKPRAHANNHYLQKIFDLHLSVKYACIHCSNQHH